MTIQNNYEIIGNQIKFYFKGDVSRGWNRIAEPEFRTLDQIKEWCTSADDGIICTWDALNQNAMSSTDATNFLYRWISWYIRTPADATKAEWEQIQQAAPDAVRQVASDITGGVYMTAKQLAHIAFDCIMFMCDVFGLFV